MIKKILLITLGFSIAAGGFWAGQAQDPAPQNPSNVRTDPPTVAAQSTQTDLTGTYAGTFNCDALGLTGDTTLTINGNEFTLADGRTGRLVTSTTKGYTAVALQIAPATGTTPTVVSMRAKKKGDRLTLTSPTGSTVKCSFTPARNVARRTPTATGTEVSSPATPAESPMPSQTPAPSPTPEPTPVPTPGDPTPSPTASPTPSPSPRSF